MYSVNIAVRVNKWICSEVYKQKMSVVGETFLHKEGHLSRPRVFESILNSVNTQVKEELYAR